MKALFCQQKYDVCVVNVNIAMVSQFSTLPFGITRKSIVSFRCTLKCIM